MTSTGDFLALVDGINKMVIPYEDISLEEVDKHLDEQISESISLDDVDNHLDAQAREAQERYDRFDERNMKELAENENLPDGWKVEVDKQLPSRGMETSERLSKRDGKE